MQATIAELQADIAAMQSVVLYYENRILRKRIAIEEIIQGSMAQVCSNLSVREMLRGIIKMQGQENGGLEYEELRQRCLKLYPEHKAKIARGHWQACRQLIDEGIPIQMPKPRKHGGNGELTISRPGESVIVGEPNAKPILNR